MMRVMEFIKSKGAAPFHPVGDGSVDMDSEYVYYLRAIAKRYGLFSYPEQSLIWLATTDMMRSHQFAGAERLMRQYLDGFVKSVPHQRLYASDTITQLLTAFHSRCTSTSVSCAVHYDHSQLSCEVPSIIVEIYERTHLEDFQIRTMINTALRHYNHTDLKWFYARYPGEVETCLKCAVGCQVTSGDFNVRFLLPFVDNIRFLIQFDAGFQWRCI
jgi:hypothetical protein